MKRDALRFTKHEATIFTAVVDVECVGPTGARRVRELAVRVDGRDDTWRVDKKSLSFEPWEAVDGGVGFATRAQANAFARRWLRGVRARAAATGDMFA